MKAMKNLKLKIDSYPVITFFIATAIMLIAFGFMGVYPFGDRQIMITDSWHQYYPILQELHYKLQHGESLFYGWRGGLGSNFLVLISYYAMSPFYLLSVVVPSTYLREFFALVTALKIGLAGSFFTIYLSGLYSKREIGTIVFGVLYAFSGFFIGYYWNIMWLDAVALLPLIILGLHRLIDDNRYGLYVATLTIAVISNFYIGFFICVFVAMYYVALYFMKHTYSGFKHFFQTSIQALMYSFLSIGLSSVFLLPIYYGMQNAYGHASANPKSLQTYHSLLDIVNNLLANIKPTIVDGLPNISVGIFSLLLVLVYFSLHTISLKQRLVNGSLVAFLLLSMNINYLNFAWHGFHFPNQVPFRFSFLLSFLLLTLAYEVYHRLDELELSRIGQVILLMCVYLLFAEKMYTTLFDYKVFYISFMIIAIYGILLAAYKRSKVTRKTFVILLLVCVILESGLSVYNGLMAGGSTSRSSYFVQNEAVQNALSWIDENDSDFYRLEIHKRYSTNDALLYGYRGVSQFSSTANAAISTFTRQLGLPSDARSNTISYTANTPALHGMIGIKYMLSKYDALPMPSEIYSLVKEEENLNAYLNELALPLGYKVNQRVLEVNLNEHHPFDKQESFYQFATGLELPLFEPVAPSQEDYKNMSRSKVEGIRFSYRNVDTGRVGEATLTFDVPKKDQYYLYMLNQVKKMDLNVNGLVTTHDPSRGIVIDLGILDPDDQVKVTFEVLAASGGYFDLSLSAFHVDNFKTYVDVLKSEAWELSSFSDTHFTGTISAEKTGVLYTSIPFDEGWTVRVNDNKVTPLAYKDALLMVPLEVGQNLIELKYVPKGFYAGGLITLFSALILVGDALMERKNKRRRN